MFSSLARSARLNSHKLLPRTRLAIVRTVVTPSPSPTPTNWNVHNRIATTIRSFSSTEPSVFKSEPPTSIDRDRAEGIQDGTLFYLRHGVSHQRLVALSQDIESSLTVKWSRMMEIYLSTQVFVISGLGYSPDEKGLQMYTQHLGKFMAEKCTDEERETFRKVGGEIWRELVATAFDLDMGKIEPINIADARNIMHKVSSKMQEPSILMKVQKTVSDLPPNENSDVELAQKHQVLQHVLVMDVYTGGSPSIVEEFGFGSGEKGYAHMQCVMAEFEADPLIAQYAQAATLRLWEAAGIDLGQMQKQETGAIRGPGVSA